MTKACEHCGVEFVASRPWSRYCSRRCRVRGYRATQSEHNRRWLQKHPDKVLEYKLKGLVRDATPERQEYHRQKYWRNREQALERLRQRRRSGDPAVEREKRRLQKAQARRKAGVPERVRLTDEERRVKKRQREREREKRYSVRARVAFELLRELGVEL